MSQITEVSKTVLNGKYTNFENLTVQKIIEVTGSQLVIGNNDGNIFI